MNEHSEEVSKLFQGLMLDRVHTSLVKGMDHVYEAMECSKSLKDKDVQEFLNIDFDNLIFTLEYILSIIEE